MDTSFGTVGISHVNPDSEDEYSHGLVSPTVFSFHDAGMCVGQSQN